MSHSTAGGTSSGVHWKQFIAECGIEYSCQFVTQFFLNPPDCLYTKKSWEFLQSYKKKEIAPSFWEIFGVISFVFWDCASFLMSDNAQRRQPFYSYRRCTYIISFGNYCYFTTTFFPPTMFTPLRGTESRWPERENMGELLSTFITMSIVLRCRRWLYRLSWQSQGVKPSDAYSSFWHRQAPCN